MSNPTGDALAANRQDRIERRKQIVVDKLAQYFCKIAGLSLIEELDGSPNWWMFLHQAGEVYDDITTRFPVQ